MMGLRAEYRRHSSRMLSISCSVVAVMLVILDGCSLSAMAGDDDTSNVMCRCEVEAEGLRRCCLLAITLHAPVGVLGSVDVDTQRDDIVQNAATVLVAPWLYQHDDRIRLLPITCARLLLLRLTIIFSFWVCSFAVYWPGWVMVMVMV